MSRNVSTKDLYDMLTDIRKVVENSKNPQEVTAYINDLQAALRGDLDAQIRVAAKKNEKE